MGIKIIEIMRGLYFAIAMIMTMSAFSRIFGYMFSGCESDWWVWQFQPLWIIPTLIMLGLAIVIIKPTSSKP